MSLRSRLVLVLGSLVALLLAAEWSLVRALTRDLDAEVDDVALAVGSSMMNLFVARPPHAPSAESAAALPAPIFIEEDVELRTHGPVLLGQGLAPEHLVGRTRVTRRSTVGEHWISLPGAGIVVTEDDAPPEARMKAVRARIHEVERRFEGEGGASLEHLRELLELEINAGDGPGLLPRFRSQVHDDGDLQVVFFGAEWPFDVEASTELESEELRVATEKAARDARGIAAFELRVGGRRLHSDEAHLVHLEAHLSARDEAARVSPKEEEQYLLKYTDAAPQAQLMAPDAPASALGGPTDTRVSIPVPRYGLERAVETFLSRLLLGSVGLFIVGLGAIGWVAHRVTRPLRDLAGAAERVGSGDLGTQVAVHGDREVSSTLEAFNHMSARLAALDEEARQLRDREHLGELGDVARGLAHALRNPLHTLGLAVDSLATTDGSREGAVEVAGAARTQIERIDGALRGFLALAAGGGERVDVRLDDLARDVALELAQSTDPVTVEVLAEAGPVTVRGIPAELRAIVHTLVVNAAEADPGGPVVVRVERLQDTFDAEVHGEGARLEVLDRGPGLADEVRERLFTPHVTTKGHGAGMGLYLAERIVRTRYSGSLALYDRPGGGTRAVLECAATGDEVPA